MNSLVRATECFNQGAFVHDMSWGLILARLDILFIAKVNYSYRLGIPVEGGSVEIRTSVSERRCHRRLVCSKLPYVGRTRSVVWCGDHSTEASDSELFNIYIGPR